MDGRNRELACKDAGVTPRYVTWSADGSPVDWVWSKNFTRRQLNESQKAVAVVKKEDLVQQLAEAAKERQRESGREYGRGKVSLPGDQPIESPIPPGRTSEHLANLAGISRHTIERAEKVVAAAKSDPEAAELVHQIESGNMRVKTALRQIEHTDQEEPPMLETTSSSDAPTEEADPFAIGPLVQLHLRLRRDARHLGADTPISAITCARECG